MCYYSVLYTNLSISLNKNLYVSIHVIHSQSRGAGYLMEEEGERLVPPSRLTPYAIQPDDSAITVTREIRNTRLTTVTYSVAIALIGALLFGYAIGYSSPVISDLEKNATDEDYLHKKEYQGIFNVSRLH